MLRKLGYFEKLIYLADQVNSFNFVVSANITGSISTEVIRKALDMIQPAYPLLNVSIKSHSEEYYFVRDNCVIPLRSFPQQFDFKIGTEINRELNTSFEPNVSPLVRVLHLYSENHHEIIITFHHVIADGMSGIHFLYHLISIADQIMGNKDIIKVDSLRDLPSIEDLMSSKIAIDNREEISNWDDKRLDKKNRKLNFTTSTAVLPFQLSREETKKIMDYCKLHQVSVHSLLCSIMCSSYFERKRYQLPRLVCLSPVNMRPYLPVAVHASDMGYFLSRIDIMQICNLETSILERAKMINSQIKELIDANAHVELINNIQAICEKYSSGDNYQSMKFDMPCIFVSNVGKINFNYNYNFSNFLVSNLHFSVACQGIIGNKDAMASTVVTVNDQMNICFQYLEPWITTKEAKEYSDMVIRKLIAL